MAGYGALADAYEWLIPDDMLSPGGSVAAFNDLVRSLAPAARVLDCSCGTGQLAVGLADLGFQVVATDASAAMVRRTEELAVEVGVSLEALQVRWEQLSDHLAGGAFDLVLCVGNSLGHAEGAAGRLAALTAMAQLLSPGGRLVVTSRNWELVRSTGSRIDVRDRLVRRNGRDALVIYYWEIQPVWEQEHHLEIAVAQLGPGGAVITCSERLSFWPYRHDELAAELESLGLQVTASTFDPSTDAYMVVAAHA